MDSPIPYFGGKSRMSKAIIEMIPPHKTYAEVFGGAAWILFRKPVSKVEILNDLDSYLINFYRVAKHHPEALAEEVATLQPSRDLFYLLRQELERPILTDIQRYSFAGRPNKPTLAIGPSRSLRCRASVARRVLPKVAERLKEVMLENLVWERFIKLYDTESTFFFVDPPYIGHREYRHNFNLDDFKALATTLKGLKGRFLMTHTDSPEIRTLFNGLNFQEIEVSYSAKRMTARDQQRPIGREVLISNY